MGIYIFRHGDARYAQGRVSLSEACDLTEEGKGTVAESTEHLAQILTKNGECTLPIKIQSSPFGRCLHTAKTIGEVLSQKRFDIRQIEIDESLREVENFEWGLFYPLVAGGKVNYGGELFDIDCNVTNPRQLTPTRYFRDDVAHHLSRQVRDSLPQSYFERIASFERCPSAVKRLRSQISALNFQEQANYVLCTHEALTGELVELGARNEEAYLQRGKYFEVKKNKDALFASFPQEGAISFSASS